MSATASVGAPVVMVTIRSEHLRYANDPEFREFAARTLRRKTKPQIRWTEERVRFLKDNYPTMILPRLTKAFNETFGVTVSERAISFQLSWRSIHKAVRMAVAVRQVKSTPRRSVSRRASVAA